MMKIQLGAKTMGQVAYENYHPITEPILCGWAALTDEEKQVWEIVGVACTKAGIDYMRRVLEN